MSRISLLLVLLLPVVSYGETQIYGTVNYAVQYQRNLDQEIQSYDVSGDQGSYIGFFTSAQQGKVTAGARIEFTTQTSDLTEQIGIRQAFAEVLLGSSHIRIGQMKTIENNYLLTPVAVFHSELNLSPLAGYKKVQAFGPELVQVENELGGNFKGSYQVKFSKDDEKNLIDEYVLGIQLVSNDGFAGLIYGHDFNDELVFWGANLTYNLDGLLIADSYIQDDNGYINDFALSYNMGPTVVAKTVLHSDNGIDRSWAVGMDWLISDNAVLYAEYKNYQDIELTDIFAGIRVDF